MTVFELFDRDCMWFRAIWYPYRRLNSVFRGPLPEIKTTGDRNPKKIITKKEIAELLFESCTACKKMAAIPQGAFAACKVRRNLERNTVITPIEEKEKSGKENMFNVRSPQQGRELTPLKYNSKLMNSIWGLYNRYSVHNFKKNTDGDDGVFGTFVAVSGAVFKTHALAANTVTAAAVAKNNP
ncbi:PREDICTED: uncharacterized protein LOC107190111 [Dufourea novaeangliae]|uniref:uncharacterized protein LOC107190111 n=1 Tax=Dufourea novaeangliae TaxID=178035 RepID=UPI0007678E15|nr:PREDICTED: uncharacterized protein LOC107190111 [Dufourea novaeangliae]